MESLFIRLFGGVSVCRGEASLPPFPTRKAKGVFAFLVLHSDRPVSRDVLAGAFWGERTTSSARKALRNAVWRVRTVLEDSRVTCGALLEADNDEVSLCLPDEARVDVVEFENALAIVTRKGVGALSPTDARALSGAIDLYRGEFLEGMYDEWAVGHQTRFQLGLVQMLDRLSAYHENRGELGPAIARCQQLLRLDPLREPAQRRLMRCYAIQGDRPSAVRQFNRCAEILRVELGIEPMAQTRDLYERIRRGDPDVDGTMVESPGQVHVNRLLRQLDRALGQIADVSARLDGIDPLPVEQGDA